MASYSKVVLMGHLTRNPELAYTDNKGTPVVEFGIATNYRRGTGDSATEEVCFTECKLFGKGAEVFAQYMTKGRPVLVDGRLTQDRWESEGQKRSKHRVVVENFTFLGRGAEGDDADDPSSKPRAGYNPGPGDLAQAADDIPF